jgi:phenylalanyl-tRNA synthetase beta chain
VSILNPISEDQNVMRTTLVPGLLETAARNLAQQVRDLRLFEVGKVFFAERGDRQPDEVEMAAALMCGGAERAGWYGKSRPVDFYDVKGALEGVFAALKTPAAVFSAVDGDDRACFLRPGHGATVTISGHFAGIVGEVRPDVLERYGIGQPVFVFELDLACLSERLPSSIQVRPTPRYPATTRDITLIVDRGLEAADALRRIEAADAPFVESVQVFDVFEGDPIPRGRKSLSIRVVYRSGEGTLADAEVNRIHGDLTRGLLDALGAELP